MRIGVVGAGSWGTTLANLLAEKGFRIDLWVYEPEVYEDILQHRENSLYLSGVKLSENIDPHIELADVVQDKDVVLMVVPSHVFRGVAKSIVGCLSHETILVSASKGIENETLLTMSGILKEILPSSFHNRLAVLSGPSFAREVCRKIPTAVTVSAADLRVAQRLQKIFATPYFRVYTSTDVIGVELGGALKNVIAIAAGVSDGLGLGDNTRAALITRGLAEIRRLGLKLGADPMTFSGLAGLGDLVLTCTGDLSRNRTVGKKLGEGMKLESIVSEMRMVAEGIKTAKSVYNLAQREGVDMPIVEQVYLMLYKGLKPVEALHTLMSRELKYELYDI
nr:NAD(P)H-dependent glycerol-3-phosphate dehydrogenase [Desulfobacterales bacterium]